MIRVEVTIEKQKDGSLKIQIDKLAREDVTELEVRIADAVERHLDKKITDASARTKRLKVNKEFIREESEG